MAQWINLNRNNSFVNPRRLPLLCGIPGAVHLALVGLSAGWLVGWLAGWQAGWLAGRLADEIQVNLNIFKKIAIDQNFQLLFHH